MTNWRDCDFVGDYFVFDDFPAERIVSLYKSFMGGQKEFTVTDKYYAKHTIVNEYPRPSIFLFNTPEWAKCTTLLDMDWVNDNAFIVQVNRLY